MRPLKLWFLKRFYYNNSLFLVSLRLILLSKLLLLSFSAKLQETGQYELAQPLHALDQLFA